MWKNKEKFAMEGRRRLGGLVVSTSLLILGLVGLIAFLRPQSKQDIQQLYTYTLTADGGYEVRLKENPLYQEGSLPEDGIYAQGLIDHLQLTVSLNYTGGGQAVLGGDYTIEAVVQGYQSGEARKVVYERRFPLLEGEISGADVLTMEESVAVKLEPYLAFKAMADKTLGAKQSSELQLVFSGTFLADSAYGLVEEPFTHTTVIPLGQELFSIKKGEAFQKSESLTETRDYLAPGDIPMALACGVVLLLSAFFGVFLLTKTRKPNREEASRIAFRTMLRKHGSRMVSLAALPPNLEEGAILLAGLDGLIKLTDELQRPICYGETKDGLPEKGILYLAGEGETYIWYMNAETTP